MSAVKIWAKIKNFQQWENPNVRYRTILRVLFDHNNTTYLTPFFLESKGSTGPNCCVTFCHNRRGREDIRFFRVLRKRDPDRTLAWAVAINRKNEDGSLWMPSQYTVICGKHFVNGEPSNDTASPDYIPSLFLTHGNPKSQDDVDRFIRAQKRSNEGNATPDQV